MQHFCKMHFQIANVLPFIITFLRIFLFISVRKGLLCTASISGQASIYVTLKLQNVKSTTVPVKGPQPCWEQDFLL